MNLAQKLPLARLGAEGLVIVLGILIALAVDRWATSIDDRTLEASYLARLVENFTADSVQIAEKFQLAEERKRLAVRVLSGVTTAEVAQPAEFLGSLERISWYSAAEYSREAWDELVSTGGLFLIRDDAIRQGLSNYYNRIEWLAHLEAGWNVTMVDYFHRAQGVLPPLTRLEVLGRLPPGSDAVPVGNEDVRRALKVLTEDADLAAELGSLALIYDTQLWAYGTVMEDIQDVLQLLRGAP